MVVQEGVRGRGESVNKYIVKSLINNKEMDVAHFICMLHRFVICQKMPIGNAHLLICQRSM